METKKEITIYKKLLECQKELGIVSKDKVNPFFKANYADINNYLEVVKPVLSKHNLILLQPLGFDVYEVVGEKGEQGFNLLTTQIIDTDNKEKIESTIRLPENPDPQKMGSIITYFRRFAIQSLLALQAEDDDAQKAVGQYPEKTYPKQKTISKPNDPATEAQKKFIYKLIKEKGLNPQDFMDEVEGLNKGQASEKIEKGIEKQKEGKRENLPTENGDWTDQQEIEIDEKVINRG